jgi:hypothetical protein
MSLKLGLKTLLLAPAHSRGKAAPSLRASETGKAIEEGVKMVRANYESDLASPKKNFICSVELYLSHFLASHKFLSNALKTALGSLLAFSIPRNKTPSVQEVLGDFNFASPRVEISSTKEANTSKDDRLSHSCIKKREFATAKSSVPPELSM